MGQSPRASAAEPRTIPRRTLAAGAAWTAPAVLLVAPAPGMAASRCVAPVLRETDFSRSSNGNFAPATGEYADQWQPGADGIRRYSSWQDNLSTTTNATKTLTATMNGLVPGLSYTVSFSVIGGFANPWTNANRNSTAVSVFVGNVSRWNGSTPASPTNPAVGVPGLAGPPTVVVPTSKFLNNPAPENQPYPAAGQYSFTFVATSASMSIAMLYTLEPRPGTSGNPSPGVDDIAISLPKIACPTV